MPYPNEHAARLRNPGDFDADSFRRKKDGTIYGRIKVPSSVSVIWAKLKGKAKPSDNPIPQALRFPTSSWSAQAAKKWLKDNNVKYIRFEPASGKNENSAPVTACVFNAAEVSFAEQQDGVPDDRFHIVAYSGGIIENHFWWGNVAFDLDGIKFAKKKTPVLMEHVRTARIGFSTDQNIDDKVVIDGRFLDNEMATELRGDMKKGFPMQASVYLPPSEIERVREGETAMVNGKTFKGPGAIFRKGKIHECSMCVLGADGDTSSKAFGLDSQNEIQFSNVERNETMDNENTMPELTADSFASNYPDLHKSLVDEERKKGDAQAVERFNKIAEICDGDHELAARLFVEGKNENEALAEKNKALKEQIAKMSEQPTQSSETTTPAESEFSDEQKRQADGKGGESEFDEDGKPTTWDAAVKHTMKNEISEKTGKKMTKTEAIRFCAANYPDLHEQLKKQNTRVDKSR